VVSCGGEYVTLGSRSGFVVSGFKLSYSELAFHLAASIFVSKYQDSRRTTKLLSVHLSALEIKGRVFEVSERVERNSMPIKLVLSGQNKTCLFLCFLPNTSPRAFYLLEQRVTRFVISIHICVCISFRSLLFMTWLYCRTRRTICGKYYLPAKLRQANLQNHDRDFPVQQYNH